MQNIKIDGLGNFSGGEYGTVHIDGVASCHGDITCESMCADGTFHCGGNLTAKTASADGTLNVSGNMTAETFEIDGAASIQGDLHAPKLSVDGSFSVKGTLHTERFDIDGAASVQSDLYAQKISVDGSLSVQGTTETDILEVDGTVKLAALRAKQFNCDGSAHITELSCAEKIHIDGTMQTDGNLEAETLYVDGCLSAKKQISADKIEICGSVQADEIVGDHIRIEFDPRPRMIRQIRDYVNSIVNNLLNREQSARDCCANLIEATTVELTGVTAGVVSGENVVIGEGCRIDRVDYTGSCFIDPSSTVRLMNGQPYNA